MPTKFIAFLALIVIVLPSFQNVFAYRMADATTVASTATAVAATPIASPLPTDQPSGPPLSLTLTLAFTCCSLSLVVGILVLGFILSMGNRKEEKEKKKKK